MDSAIIDGRVRYTLNGFNIYTSMFLAITCKEKFISEDDPLLTVSKIISSHPFQYVNYRNIYGPVKLDKAALELTVNDMYFEGLDWISSRGAEAVLKEAAKANYHPENLFFIVNRKESILDVVHCFAMKNANCDEAGKLRPISSSLGSPELFSGGIDGLCNFLRDPATVVRITMPLAYTAHPCYKKE